MALLAKKEDLEEENGGENDGSLGMEDVKDKVADEITMAGVVEGKILILGIGKFIGLMITIVILVHLFRFFFSFSCNFHTWIEL